MKQKLKFVFIVALFILISDHLTKWLVVKYIPLGAHLAVIPGIFDISHGRNTGAAFGFLSNWDSPLRNWFFYIIGIIAAVFLYYYIKAIDIKDKISLTALALILGGALGNITDRIARSSVVDFLSFHYYDRIWDFTLFGYKIVIPLSWPSFNVADSAISVAVVLLILQNLRTAKNSNNQKSKVENQKSAT